jgi:hypothetical protein
VAFKLLQNALAVLARLGFYKRCRQRRIHGPFQAYALSLAIAADLRTPARHGLL